MTNTADYLKILLGLIGLVTFIWKTAADYTTMKNLQKNMATKLDMAELENRIREFLRQEFVTRREFEARK